MQTVTNNDVEGGLNPRYVHKMTTKDAINLVLFIMNQLKDCTPKYQHIVMEKFINHPLMKGFLPPYLQDIAIFKQNEQIMVTLKKGLTSHLVGVRQSKVVLAKDIVCTRVAFSKPSRSNRRIARILGVDRWNIKKVVESRVLLDTQMDAFWLMHKCHKHTYCLLDVVSILVRDWWEKETTISPNMKDIVKRWIGLNLYEAHPTHYLQVS